VDLADLAELASAVHREGYDDRADWLVEREQILRADDSAERTNAIRELRGVVHGMGGLLDMTYSASDEPQRVYRLIDRLWAETAS
jgi:hypothetical protein